MGSAPKAPAAPDPAKTAAAQTATNKETAYWNAVLNNVNQITPYGNLTYAQTGGGKQYNQAAYDKALNAWNAAPQTSTQLDAHGRPIGTSTADRGAMPKLADFQTGDAPPSFTSTIQLSPEQQKIYETQTGQQQQLLDLGGEQIGRIKDSVSSPYSYSGVPDAFTSEDAATASKRGEEAILSRLNPQFQHDEEALRTRLINQGIGQGSDAYDHEFDQFNKTQNDARMQAILQGANYGGTLQQQALQRRNQGIQEYDTQRNAPLNEYIGLTSGTQVQNPQFSSQNYQGANPVDYANLVNNQYQANLGAYNSKVAGQNNTTNSLFGLGASFLGAPATGGGSLFGKLFGF